MSPLRFFPLLPLLVLSLSAQVDPRPFAARYGPATGTPVPVFSAVDQAGVSRDLASLRGPKGTWLLFVRSADW